MEENQINEPAGNEASDSSAVVLWKHVTRFLNELLDIRKDSDRSETIESVKKDISFKGHNAWILIFSIMVASIGLNANSTAVVIGAMLISPLMGPIIGVGLGTAINDEEMLKRSFWNLLVMVVLSLFTATIYFLLTPIKDFVDELSARTEPNILDVLVAIFGGLALIVAKAKKGTISNAIAGVAIATALMPPLCTAGYGIANGEWLYFGGAMYLFFINSVFIALSTFVVCKLLRFPMVKYANAARRKKVSRIATVIGLIVLAPSIYFFILLLQKQQYESEAIAFVEEYISQPGTRAQAEWNNIDKKLDVILVGREVPQATLDDWEYKFHSKERFENCNIEFYQNGRTSSTDADSDVEKLQEERINDIKLIQDKDQRIAALEDELRQMNKQSQQLGVITDEAMILYPEISRLSYAPVVNRDFVTKQYDTADVFTIAYKDSTISSEAKTQVAFRMQNWLKFRMKSEKVELNEFKPTIVPKDSIAPEKENVKPVKRIKS
ncbi:MAG: DUF389 domain-containing protein [Nonlabens sp.]